MKIKINSVDLAGRHKPLLLALFTQANHSQQVWKASEPYTLRYQNHEFTVTLSNTVIRRLSKSGTFRYETLGAKPLGFGTYGEVYPVEVTREIVGNDFVVKNHPYGKRRVAKVFNGDRTATREFLLTLKTPHVHPKAPIRVREDGEWRAYLLTKRMEGQELFEIIDDDLTLSYELAKSDSDQNAKPQLEKPLSLEMRFKLTTNLLIALKKQVFDAGLVHRDIKPENIITDLKQGVTDINIIDYGFAKLDGSISYESIGTEGYISPEAMENKTTSFPRDIYSMGRVLVPLWHMKIFNDTDCNLDRLCERYATKKETLILRSQDTHAAFIFGRIPGFNPEAAQIIGETIYAMLAEDPKKRLTLDQTLASFARAQDKQLHVGATNSHSISTMLIENVQGKLSGFLEYPRCAAKFFKDQFTQDSQRNTHAHAHSMVMR